VLGVVQGYSSTGIKFNDLSLSGSDFNSFVSGEVIGVSASGFYASSSSFALTSHFSVLISGHISGTNDARGISIDSVNSGVSFLNLSVSNGVVNSSLGDAYGIYFADVTPLSYFFNVKLLVLSGVIQSDRGSAAGVLLSGYNVQDIVEMNVVVTSLVHALNGSSSGILMKDSLISSISMGYFVVSSSATINGSEATGIHLDFISVTDMNSTNFTCNGELVGPAGGGSDMILLSNSASSGVWNDVYFESHPSVLPAPSGHRIRFNNLTASSLSWNGGGCIDQSGGITWENSTFFNISFCSTTFSAMRGNLTFDPSCNFTMGKIASSTFTNSYFDFPFSLFYSGEIVDSSFSTVKTPVVTTADYFCQNEVNGELLSLGMSFFFVQVNSK
jgi:hypothetical protein